MWNDFVEQNIPSSKSRDLLITGALEAAFREMVRFFTYNFLCIIDLILTDCVVVGSSFS